MFLFFEVVEVFVIFGENDVVEGGVYLVECYVVLIDVVELFGFFGCEKGVVDVVVLFGGVFWFEERFEFGFFFCWRLSNLSGLVFF